MEFRRITSLPPYVFTIIDSLKVEARRAGEDIIDLGFGNPDLPSPAIAVEKLTEAAHNERNHRYSASRGIPKLRQAAADYYKRRFDVDLDPDTEVINTIGGGHLEFQAIEEARALLRQPTHESLVLRYPLGPSLGQCCGGAVELRFEALEPGLLECWTLPAARFHLCLYGAGHVGQALARILTDIDCAVDWIDVREGAFEALPPEAWTRSPTLRCVVSDGPVAEACAAPPGAHHVVMTHSHALDFDLVQALLRRHDTGMVGLIGSRTKRQRFEHRLLARGVSADRVAALVCPIGTPA